MSSQWPSLAQFRNQCPRQIHPEPVTTLSMEATQSKQAQDLRKVKYTEQGTLAVSIQTEISGNFQKLERKIIIHRKHFPLLSKDLPLIFKKLFGVELEHSLSHSQHICLGGGVLAVAHGSESARRTPATPQGLFPPRLGPNTETRDPTSAAFTGCQGV